MYYSEYGNFVCDFECSVIRTRLTRHKNYWMVANNTGQQNLTFFFGTRGKISNPNRTFNAEFKSVSSFSPSPTVCL